VAAASDTATSISTVTAADTVTATATDTVSEQEDNAKSVVAGNVLLLLDGGIDFPSSRLLDQEKNLNQINSTVLYNDGSVQNPQVQHVGYRWGITGEYLLTDDLGVQLGFASRTLQQTVSTGGDGYETKNFAQGTLLSYGNPYLGAAYYLLNQDDANLYAAVRGGVVTGKIYPLVTTNEYFNQPVQSYDLGGFNASLGLGISYVYEWLVLGFSCYVTEDFFRTSQKVYPDLDQSFTLTSLDLDFSIGYKF
jgi:hypothetical protein